jgi:putative transcriptional regulator
LSYLDCAELEDAITILTMSRDTVSKFESAHLNFANHFLVAMPAMQDPTFAGTVVFITEHTDAGAQGLVINQPLDLPMQGLYERLDLPLNNSKLGEQPVLKGGPVNHSHGYVLHKPLGNYISTVAVTDGVGVTKSRDVLEAVSRGEGPEHIIVCLGYAGWGAGQLEDEVAANTWLTVPATDDLIFDTPLEERFNRAFGLLGINPMFLSASAGHA